MRAILLLAVTIGGAVWAPDAPAQTGFIAGTIRNGADGAGLPYSVVTLPATRGEVLANERGAFLVRGLAAGRIEMRFRRVGFIPLDTVVAVTAGDTTRIDVSLMPLSTRLPAIRVLGSSRVRLADGCPAFPSENDRLVVMNLLDQFIQNADQYRALVRAHPFWLRFTHTKLTRGLDGNIVRAPPEDSRLGPVDHFILVASDRAVYQPGKVFRTVRGVDEVFVPELQDFADEQFMLRHCFSYAGDTTIDGTALVRLAFAPVTALTEPDIQGTAYLRARDYGLAAVDMRTTGVSPRFAKTYDSVRVLLRYRNLLPGIVVLSHLESYLIPAANEQRRFPSLASRGEMQDIVGVQWLKGPPGGEVTDVAPSNSRALGNADQDRLCVSRFQVERCDCYARPPTSCLSTYGRIPPFV